MWTSPQRLLDSSTLSPHGICLLWELELIWLHVVSDAIIAASYFSIPIVLSIFVSKRRDVDFGFIFWAFAIFITACDFTHVFSIITLWVPVYGLEGLVKLLTAVASIVTALILWPLLPKLLALPSRNAIVHQGRLDPGVSLLQKPLTQVTLAAKIREILDKPKALAVAGRR